MYIPTWKDANGNTILRATLHAVRSGDASVSAVDDTVYYAADVLLGEDIRQQLMCVENIMLDRLKEVSYGLYHIEERDDHYAVLLTPNILFREEYIFEKSESLTDSELRSRLGKWITQQADSIKHKIVHVNSSNVYTEVNLNVAENSNSAVDE